MKTNRDSKLKTLGALGRRSIDWREVCLFNKGPRKPACLKLEVSTQLHGRRRMNLRGDSVGREEIRLSGKTDRLWTSVLQKMIT